MYNIKRIDPYRILIPKQANMLVDGIVYADDKLFKHIEQDECLKQVMNVATLPGIVKASLAMPDIHWGYGFPIGGVAAFDKDTGIISPGGVGYDINCGVRLLKTDLNLDETKPLISDLIALLFQQIPSGMGGRGLFHKLSPKDYSKVLKKGARWTVEQGFGDEEDLYYLESQGCIPGANPDLVSLRAKKRGEKQLGSLGSGNHFLEIEYVDEIYDKDLANELGLYSDQICISIHCGSRGLGHQTCDDQIGIMQQATHKYGISLPDRQLCCAPLTSSEGKNYFAAMAAAANYAFANRQAITHQIREVFSQVFRKGSAKLGINVVYDVCHNIAKFEKHIVDGVEKTLCVHRKGATRAFPPHHPELNEAHQRTGQPVLIPGDMGRYSYVLTGTEKGYAETFGSCCHGAGRVLSRKQALKQTRGRNLFEELKKQGVEIQAQNFRTVGEEAPEAYKDAADVVSVVENAGLAKKVLCLKPLGVIKG